MQQTTLTCRTAVPFQGMAGWLRLLQSGTSRRRNSPMTFTRWYGTGRASASASTAQGGRDGGTTGQYNRTAEEEEDRLLEEEEFATLRESDGDEFLPFAHRLAHKADALDAELRRIRYCLRDRRQLLVDTFPATLSGRPTRVDKVIERLRRPPLDAEASAGRSAPSADPAARTYRSTLALEAALRASPFAHWCGTSAAVLRFFSGRLLRSRTTVAVRPSAAGAEGSIGKVHAPSHGTELATLDANLDYLRRVRALHQLNYYSRLNLTPKRHIWASLYQILWNAIVAVQDAIGCIIYGILRGIKKQGMLWGVCTGAATGLGMAAQFLFYGWIVSPVLHISRGLCNTLYGPLNCLTGAYMFDALSGRWMRCTVVDSRLFRHELQREKRLLRTIGRAEFRRKRMKVERRWADRMASMGFSVDMMVEKLRPKAANGPQGEEKTAGGATRMRDPYDVLQVRRTADTAEIKRRYKKLAMVFHPDVVRGRQGGGVLPRHEEEAAQRKFEEIANAYQILSNREKRKAYDLGGVQGVQLHETKFGKFMSRTPEEMVQGVFGGEGFRRVLIGELLRSHWALRNEAQVSVSLHELEELQCIRVRQMAIELAAIADVHARRPTMSCHRMTPAGGGSDHRRSQTAPFLASHGLSSNSSLRNNGNTDNRPNGTGARTRSSNDFPVGREMHETIMEELGERKASGTRSRTAKKARTIHDDCDAMSADSRVASSPFSLRPGSNEDNCFSRDFDDRCDRFVRHLADACFGKQLLYEVGEAYVVGAQRFLGIRPFYAPKALVTRKIFSGMDRIYDAFKDKSRLSKEQVTQKIMAEYFNMEYDAVVADAHSALRYAVQMVLQDVAETEEVRRKRCYAVWFLGEKMMSIGERWTSRITTDEDLVAYIQQAATAAATTSKPPAF